MECFLYVFKKIDWGFVVNFISALGSVLACYIAYKISKEISFKRSLRQKQLETVFDLVNELQSLKLYFFYKNDGKAVGDVWFHFFEMTHNKYLNENDIPIDDYTIYVSKTFLYESAVFKFVNNPFLPKSIADNLIRLYPRGGDEVTLEVVSNLEIYISESRPYTGKNYRKEISRCYSSMENIFDATNALIGSINSWLKAIEADELRLMTRKINIENHPL